MRGKSLISMAFVFMLALSLAMIPVRAQPPPTMYIDPSVSSANPCEHFDVNVNIRDCPDISGFEFKLKFDPKILDLSGTEPVVTEGPFLKWPSAGGGPYATSFKVQRSVIYEYVLVSNVLLEEADPAPGGEGTLATFTFHVKKSGVTNLELFGTFVLDYAHSNRIDTLAESGFFGSTAPMADFTWTPSKPDIGTTVNFDASASYDPDQESGPPTAHIVLYEWDFDEDGIYEYSDITPYASHVYTQYRFAAYTVKLRITDDDQGLSSVCVKELRIWRDIAIMDVWPTLDDWDLSTSNYKFARGSLEWWGPGYGYGPCLTVIISITNLGTIDETTTYHVYLDADPTVIGDEYEAWWAYTGGYGATFTVKAGGGSGWLGYFYLDLVESWTSMHYIPSGVYTLTAIADTFPGECVTANNMMQCQIEIYEVETNLIAKRITNHGFSKSIHGPIMTFYSKIKNVREAKDLPAPEGTSGTWVSFEIETPFGDTIVLDTPEIDQSTLAPKAEVEMEPQELNTCELPCGSYAATGLCYYYYYDVMVNPWNALFISKKVQPFSFYIRP